MVKKIEYTHKIWNMSENNNICCLIEEFAQEPDTESEIFEEITDCIWDSGSCKPIFYAVIPYLIEIASNLDYNAAKDLWCYLGSWISVQDKYRNDISGDVLELFDLSLKTAQKECIRQIVSVEKIETDDALYLYAGLFAFAKHRIGYMTMGSYKDDIVGVSTTKCRLGHLNDVMVYNSGIVPFDHEECSHDVPMAEFKSSEGNSDPQNPWIDFLDKFENVLNYGEVSEEIKSHLLLAESIVKSGITSALPMRYAFSLYGSLLYCNGSHDEGKRILHGWDKIICDECGEEFVFADGWCEDIW